MRLLAAPLCFFVAGALSAQAVPTATRTLDPSAFVLLTGVGTGLGAYGKTEFPGGKNIAVTAGLNLGFLSVHSFTLGVEARGTYPLRDGKIASERSILGGLRISGAPFGRGQSIRPYFNLLAGGGQLDHPRPGYATASVLYLQTRSTVLAAGGGLEIAVAGPFCLKVDAQAQRWETPVLPGRTLLTGQASVGVAYRIGAGGGPR